MVPYVALENVFLTENYSCASLFFSREKIAAFSASSPICRRTALDVQENQREVTEFDISSPSYSFQRVGELMYKRFKTLKLGFNNGSN